MKMVKYQKEQLARKDAQIAALKRQNKALYRLLIILSASQREVKRLRMDPHPAPRRAARLWPSGIARSRSR